MTDTLDIECVPYDEDCAQVGDPNYATRSRLECRALIGQIKRQFGEPPTGVVLRVKSNPHDFGTYHSIEIQFNDSNEAAVEWAYSVEARLPAEWDEPAIQELKEGGYYGE